MNHRGRRRRRRYYSNQDCHLCGLPIPFEIVNPGHPLFGTIDHVVPRADGGPDHFYNRLPAHRICNAFRNRKEITDEVKAQCFEVALAAFRRGPIPPTVRFNRVRRLVSGRARSTQ